MERTNCKLPERLEKLQTLWRERKSSVKGWGDYFRGLFGNLRDGFKGEKGLRSLNVYLR